MSNNTSVLNIYGDYRDLDLNYSITSQDYFVHMLRFSKVVDLVHGKNIFDIGCGKYVNLLKALCMMRRGPDYKTYIGTDYGKCQRWRPNYEPIWDKTLLYDEMDFTDAADIEVLMNVLEQVFEDESFIITCFEVLEHMDFEMQNKFLYNLSRILHNPKLDVECCLFSTPNHNGSPAKNHISEISYKLEEEMFDRFDIDIIKAQGLSAWKKFCKPENLDSGSSAPLYTELMPDPIKKMIWGAALPRQFSNNILYSLNATKSKLKEYEELIKEPYKWGEYRQGGSKQMECEFLFSKSEE